MTNYVLQPPCCGAALALEAWAIGGPDVRLERFGPHALAVSYDSVRWVYCAGIGWADTPGDVHTGTLTALAQMRAALAQAGCGFEHVVRTWFYLGGITEVERRTPFRRDEAPSIRAETEFGAPAPARLPQRYQELNRARTEFYQDIRFGCAQADPHLPHGLYPASTGIGMGGAGLVTSCLTLQTQRPDAFLLPLENPQQTPAYAYHSRYSPHSPKFSRAMALVLGQYVTTWISGTASIVSSESRCPGDIAGQTEQTIDNIERLVAPENFASHGVRGAGARLQDLAKIRVYLKRPEDFARCRETCVRRFGPVPAIYAVADVCRPELLVEIEGVAFSSLLPPGPRAGR